jgi:hypothetical protein
MLNPIIHTILNILNIPINRINLNNSNKVDREEEELTWMICFIRRRGWMMLMMRMMGMVSFSFSLFFLFRVIGLEGRGVSLASVVSSHSSLRRGATQQTGRRIIFQNEKVYPSY